MQYFVLLGQEPWVSLLRRSAENQHWEQRVG